MGEQTNENVSEFRAQIKPMSYLIPAVNQNAIISWWPWSPYWNLLQNAPLANITINHTCKEAQRGHWPFLFLTFVLFFNLTFWFDRFWFLLLTFFFLFLVFHFDLSFVFYLLVFGFSFSIFFSLTILVFFFHFPFAFSFVSFTFYFLVLHFQFFFHFNSSFLFLFLRF